MYERALYFQYTYSQSEDKLYFLSSTFYFNDNLTDKLDIKSPMKEQCIIIASLLLSLNPSLLSEKGNGSK